MANVRVETYDIDITNKFSYDRDFPNFIARCYDQGWTLKTITDLTPNSSQYHRLLIVFD